jgi:Xaa-Pro aminopeptidase
MTYIKPLGYDQGKCRALMEERSLSGMVVTSPENVFYTTGLPTTRGFRNPMIFGLANQFPSYSVLHADGSPILVTWTGVMGGHEFWVKDIRTTFRRGETQDLLHSAVASTFAPGARIGVESSMPLSIANKIKQQVKDAELVVSDEIMDTMRMTKSEGEIAMLSRSLDIAEKTVEIVERHMTPETTVFQLITDASRTVYDLGATGLDHMTIAIGHSNPEIPIDLPAKAGDIVVLDVGAIFEGYVSDNRRLAYIGKVEEDLRKLNATMAEIVVQTGMSAAPGVSFGDLCVKAEQLHKERGLPPMFLSAGHTIGIQTEEMWISKGSDVKFGEGVLFNIELYSMLKPGTYVGTEDTFVVTSNGVRQLSHLPHEIKEVL